MRLDLVLLAVVLLGYLIGSIPFGLIVAGLVGGIDIRLEGSGNIGATNVARILGAKYGVLVLALDAIKGAAPTYFLPMLLPVADLPQRLHVAVLSGVSAILGHMFPCWLGFRGGKGVATALGVAVVLAPAASAVALAVFVISFAATRIVSLSSIVGSSAFCGFELWQLRPAPFAVPTWSLALFSSVMPLLIIVRHRTNLARLLSGTEPRFRFGGTKREAAKETVEERPPGSTN